MSVIMVIIDGAEIDDYEGCSYINKAPCNGLINNIPKGRVSSSLSCIMNMLHVPLKSIPKGRAYLETIALDLPILKNDLIFRCNNVYIESNQLKHNINEDLNMNFGSLGFLISMDSYKNLLILHDKAKLINSLKTYAPHEHFNEDLDKIFPKCRVDKELEKFLRRLITKYSIFPWGESIKCNLPDFTDINKVRGAAICKTEIVKGIAKGLNMYCPDLKNATADIDTDLEEKTKLALTLKDKYDFILIHINGTDECAHRRNKKEKLDFIEKIDKVVIKTLYENIDKNTSLIVTSDHGTSSLTGEHLYSDVKYFVFNENKEAKFWLKR